jgi:hypothetical protein
LPLLLWIDHLSLELVGCTHDGGYVVRYFSKGFPCDLTRQIKPVPSPTLGANEPTPAVLIVPPEPIIPTAHRARAMPVDQKLGINPKGNEQVPPITLCYRPYVAHGLGASGSGIQ